MSGGGGAALYLSYRECAGPNRGALFHAVAITINPGFDVSGRVLQAFAPADAPPPHSF